MEGEQGDHVREQRDSKAEPETRRQAAVPQDALDERRHQADVAWRRERRREVNGCPPLTGEKYDVTGTACIRRTH